VTWRDVPNLRDRLFDVLERPDLTGVRLDVRGVSRIDLTGIRLLVGANQRAAALGRQLVLIDRDGPVSVALARVRMLGRFLVAHSISRLPVGSGAESSPLERTWSERRQPVEVTTKPAPRVFTGP